MFLFIILALVINNYLSIAKIDIIPETCNSGKIEKFIGKYNKS